MFFPSATSFIALSKYSRLAGDRRRYSVSSHSGPSELRFPDLWSTDLQSDCPLTLISTSWSGYAACNEFTNPIPISLVLSRYIASMPNSIAEATVQFKKSGEKGNEEMNKEQGTGNKISRPWSGKYIKQPQKFVKIPVFSSKFAKTVRTTHLQNKKKG